MVITPGAATEAQGGVGLRRVDIDGLDAEQRQQALEAQPWVVGIA